jgi:hypothetical protein
MNKKLIHGILICLVSADFLQYAIASDQNARTSAPLRSHTNDYPDLRSSKEFFKRYLENPYPVRKVVFFEPKDANFPSNVLLCEGSLQPDTFYVRQLTIPRVLEDGKYKNLSDGQVTGKSSSGEYWFINDEASRGKGGVIGITKAEVSDPFAMTSSKNRAYASLPSLHDACWFGFNFMIPHTAVWQGDQFTTRFLVSQMYPQTTNTYEVSGEVVAWTNNLPLIIRLKSDHWPKKLQWLEFTYEYDFSQKDRFYPIKVTSVGVIAGDPHPIEPMSTETVSIEFGSDLFLFKNGYTVSNFVPQEVATQPNVYITSTQGEYWVNEKQFISTGPPATPKRPLFAMTPFVRAVLIFLMILPAVFLIRWRKKPN